MDAVIPARPANGAVSMLAGLHRLLDWWGQGLRLALPLRLRSRWFPLPPGVWLRFDNAVVQAWVGRRDELAVAVTTTGVDADTVLSRYPDLPRWLLLAPSNAVRAGVTLPQAAGAHLREALRYEIDRQTPFTANDVAWDARALEVDPVAKTVRAELIAVPLTRLSPYLAQAQSMGLVLQGVDVADEEGLPAGVNLLPVELRLQPVNRWRRRNMIMAALAVGLVLAAAVISIQRERMRTDALQQQLEQDRGEARRVAEQRQRLTQLTEGARRIHAQRQSRAPLPALLNDLAERVPGNGYIERLTVQGSQMQLSGVAPQSTRLVPALQGSALWKDVTMSGAVAADVGRGGDRYTLGMRLVPVTSETTR